MPVFVCVNKGPIPMDSAGVDPKLHTVHLNPLKGGGRRTQAALWPNTPTPPTQSSVTNSD